MDDKRIYNINVIAQDVLLTPEAVKQRLPMTPQAHKTVLDGRHTVERILDRHDHRLMVVVGPCSIHDPGAAIDYAQRLKRLADQVSDTLYVVMRVYFEKPRTTVGWKGFIGFGGVTECKFRMQVPPGVRMYILGQKIWERHRRIHCAIQGVVNGQLAFECELTGTEF